MDKIQELQKVITEIDIPFKISAGPGAGKTTWLVNHVQNVLKNSDKLNRNKQVACITYTRIGADTINKKVKEKTGTNRLDIGTIHSFLYRNVVKPFSSLIEKDDNGDDLFNIDELSGHIEYRLIWDRLRSWKSEIEKDNGKEYKYFTWTNKRSLLISKLNCIEHVLDANEDIKTVFTKSAYRYDIAIPTSNDELLKYKKTYWRYGIMHHEDVLFFTHYIFKKNPRVIEFVSNKFPYLFLDEFQDTNPLQTWIIKKIAKQGTIVGVIGDPAQSIFEFAGARRKDFNDFTLPKLKYFKKSNNYRSTHKIIDFLKKLRDDIEQIPSDKTSIGEEVVVLVGHAAKAIDYVKDLDDDDFAVLCRWNKDVSNLKYSLKNVGGDNLISLLYSEESDNRRPRFIHSLLKAYDFNESGEYKEAIKELKKQLRGASVEGLEKRKIVINILDYLKDNLDTTIVDIYKHLQPILKKQSVILKGLQKAKDVHKKTFKDLLPFLSKQTKISSKIRTIHQAKGDEFNNVLLCLFDKTDKNDKVRKKLETILSDYIFNAKTNISLDTEVGEDTRLVYVACSRARNRLFVNVPRLSVDHEDEFKKIGAKIVKN